MRLIHKMHTTHIKTVITRNLVTKWLPLGSVPLKRLLLATENVNCHEGHEHG